MKTVDVGKDFYFRLANRNELQGDGKHTALEFRSKYLSELDNELAWKDMAPFIIFDFTNVKRIGPSFANEAFAYFMKYTKPDNFMQKIQFKNIDEVDTGIIRKELLSGYKK
jgi:hypothetical protein